MGIVLAYHGCDQTAAQALLGGSPFLPSDKPYDWLGSGVYFWEDDVTRAYQWSLEHSHHAPCVVGAAIELGHCLDLTKQSGIQAVKTAHALHLKLLQETGQQPPVNRAAPGSKPGDFVLRYLDRAVINYLHDSYAITAKRNQGKAQEFDTVRAMFPEGEPIYATSGFMEKTHVQIAVRKPKQVLGVFRVPAHQLEQLQLPNLYNF